MGAVGAILTVVHMILMIGTIIPTENALKKTFDELVLLIPFDDAA